MSDQLPGQEGLAAIGTTQQTAFPLAVQDSVFATVPPGSGCRLPGPSGGAPFTVYNQGANALLVYPAAGDQIAPNAQNAAVSVAPGTAVTFISFDNPLSPQPRTWQQQAIGGVGSIGPTGPTGATGASGSFSSGASGVAVAGAVTLNASAGVITEALTTANTYALTLTDSFIDAGSTVLFNAYDSAGGVWNVTSQTPGVGSITANFATVNAAASVTIHIRFAVFG